MGGRPAIPESVLAVAHQHVTGLPPVRGFRWRLPAGRRVASGWYFDHEVERLPTNRSRPGSGFGFPPGFVVTDDGTVRVVAWHELRAVHGLPPVV